MPRGTNQRKRVLAVMPWDDYETLLETIDIMGDAELMKQIREGIKAIERGEVIPFEELKKELIGEKSKNGPRAARCR